MKIHLFLNLLNDSFDSSNQELTALYADIKNEIDIKVDKLVEHEKYTERIQNNSDNKN
jgi:hypothetical protein